MNEVLEQNEPISPGVGPELEHEWIMNYISHRCIYGPSSPGLHLELRHCRNQIIMASIFFREWYVTFLPPHSQQHCSEHCCLISTTLTTFIHRKSVILYTVPPTRTKLGERAFSVTGPTAWNSLPRDIRKITDTSTFKRHLNFTL